MLPCFLKTSFSRSILVSSLFPKIKPISNGPWVSLSCFMPLCDFPTSTTCQCQLTTKGLWLVNQTPPRYPSSEIRLFDSRPYQGKAQGFQRPSASQVGSSALAQMDLEPFCCWCHSERRCHPNSLHRWLAVEPYFFWGGNVGFVGC